MKFPYKILAADYPQYVLPPQAGIAYLMLCDKIDANECEQHFTAEDIEVVVKDLEKMTIETFKADKLLRSWQPRFVEPVPNQAASYQMAEYGKGMRDLIHESFFHTKSGFTIEDAFRNHIQLDSEVVRSIYDLDQWHRFDFKNGREILDSHLERMKQEVDEICQSIHIILNQSGQELQEHLSRFKAAFDQLGKRAEELKKVIHLGFELQLELSKRVDFYVKAHREARTTGIDAAIAKSDMREAQRIKDDVAEFFIRLQQKTDHIIRRLSFAWDRLNELVDNLSQETQFRANLRLATRFLLEEIQYGGKNPIVPQKLCRKISHGSLRLPRFLDSARFMSRSNPVYRPAQDPAHEAAEDAAYQKSFDGSDRIRFWIKLCLEILESIGYLDFSGNYFYRILEEEGNVHIPINVACELALRCEQIPHYEIMIGSDLVSNQQFKDVLLCKLIIRNKNI